MKGMDQKLFLCQIQDMIQSLMNVTMNLDGPEISEEPAVVMDV